MGIKMVDTAEPMNENGYPVARAKHIWFSDNETLQEKLNNGSLGSGGASYIELSQEEYDNLTDDERLSGREYRIYDRGRIFKLGVEYGKDACFTSLSQLGLTADATLDDVITAMPKGSSALIGVTEFTNAQTMFPYEEGNDYTFGRVFITKGNDNGRTYVKWFRKDGAKECIAKMDLNTNAIIGWQQKNTKGLVTNAQNFKIDLTKNNAYWYGMFTFNFVYGTTPCEITVTITDKVYYTITKGQNLVSAITYTQDGAKYTIGIDLTAKVYGTQVVDMPSEFGTINSLTAETFAGTTTAISKGYGFATTDKIDGIEITQSIIDTYGTEILKYPIGKWRISNVNLGNKLTDLPRTSTGAIITIESIYPTKSPWTDAWAYRQYKFESSMEDWVFIRTLNSGDTAGVLQRDSGWKQFAIKTVTTLAELGLTADATIQDVIDALPIGGNAIIRTDSFTNWSTLFNGIQWGYLKIEKTVNGMCLIELTEVLGDCRMYYGKQGSGKFVEWQRINTNEILHTSLSGNLAGITTVLDLVNALLTEYRALSPKKPIRFVNGEITKTTLTDLPVTYGVLQITVAGWDVVEVRFAHSASGFKTMYYGFLNRITGEELISSITWEKVATTDYVDSKLGDIYSTTAQPIGTWIDGSTIYRQVFECADIEQSTTHTTVTLCKVPQFGQLISVRGFGKIRNVSAYAEMPFYNGTHFTSLKVYTDGQVDAYGPLLGLSEVKIIVEFIKKVY